MIPNTDWQHLKNGLKPVEQVLSYDLERLKRMDRTRRTEIWNNIVINQQKFEDGACGDIENKEDSPLLKEFNLSGSRGREVPFRKGGDESYPLQ